MQHYFVRKEHSAHVKDTYSWRAIGAKVAVLSLIFAVQNVEFEPILQAENTQHILSGET